MEGIWFPALECLGWSQFYSKPGPFDFAKLNLPVYLHDQVQTRLAALASAKGVDLSVLVNDLLRKDIELIEMAR